MVRRFAAVKTAVCAVALAGMVLLTGCGDKNPGGGGGNKDKASVSYLIMFDANGGTVVPTSDTTRADGKLASLPTPQYVGHEFEGWFTAADTSGTKVDTGYVFTKDTTIYAQWTEKNIGGGTDTTGTDTTGTDTTVTDTTVTDTTVTDTTVTDTVAVDTTKTPETYAVTFDSRGGSGVGAHNVEHGGTTTEPAEPTRAGYNFDGWYKDSTYTAAWDFDTDAVTSAVTLYAKWTTVEVHTVTFDSRGGSVVNPHHAEHGSKTTEPATAPTRTGYTFGGWYKENTYTTAWNFATDVVTSATTIYAKWTPISYSINYELDGGTASNPATYNIETATFALTEPTKEHYTFTGWTGANGTTPQKPVSITVGSTGVKTYTANWTPIPYLITYDLDDGTASPANPASYNIETAAFTLNNPTKAGYTFAGWTGANGTTAQTSVSVALGNTGDKTYTATWTIIVYTITFDANSGTVSTASGTTTIVEGYKLASLPTAEKDGYIFDWFTAATGGEKVTESKVYSGNTTIYAQWRFAFIDNRDNKEYNKVTIGSQTWMKENLNYDVPGVTTDVCYENNASNCATYGRLYDWNTAMDNAAGSSASPSGVQGACPVGWHLPSNDEWTTLTTFVGTPSGTKLKSTSGWNSDGNGTDEYWFSALPGGNGNGSGGFPEPAGDWGLWWTSTVVEGNQWGSVWTRFMSYLYEDVELSSSNKPYKLSVRCVQD